MVKTIYSKGELNIDVTQVLGGKSTDTKPTEFMPDTKIEINDNAMFIGKDTKEVYMFDKETSTWV